MKAEPVKVGCQVVRRSDRSLVGVVVEVRGKHCLVVEQPFERGRTMITVDEVQVLA